LAPLFAGASDSGSRRRRWTDRIVGIVVGLLLGLGVLVFFVFFNSEGTIDAPKISGVEIGKPPVDSTPKTPPAPGAPVHPRRKGSAKKPIPTVKVIGGAPPTGAGPKKLTFHKGERVRIRVETDEPFSFEIRGLGVHESIETTSIVSFDATRAGQFPMIATATLIGVADLMVKAAH